MLKAQLAAQASETFRYKGFLDEADMELAVCRKNNRFGPIFVTNKYFDNFTLQNIIISDQGSQFQ